MSVATTLEAMDTGPGVELISYVTYLERIAENGVTTLPTEHGAVSLIRRFTIHRVLPERALYARVGLPLQHQSHPVQRAVG